jgi:hypothetical protein
VQVTNRQTSDDHAPGKIRKLPTLGYRQLPKPTSQPKVKVHGTRKILGPPRNRG